MSAPGQGQAGSGVAPGGPNEQGPTTTSIQLEPATPAARSATSSPASTNSSSSSNGQKAIIIGSVLGGVGALLLLSLLVICCTQRQTKQQAIKKKGAQRVTYTGLNFAFAGVPFRDSQHSSISPKPLLLTNSNTSYAGAPSPGQRTGESEVFLYNSKRDFDSPQQTPQHSPGPSPRHWPLHPYSPARYHTHSRADSNSSPITPNDPSEAHVLSSHEPFSPGELERPAVPTPQTRDTMGFPVDSSAALEEMRLQTMTPALLSPRPRHPLAHQDSLEQVVRDGMLAPSPAPSNSAPGRSRVISQDYPRESPVLGLENPLIIQNPGGLGRNESQRTVSSMDSMGPIIGDEELENLGIGARPASLRVRQG